MRKRPDTLLTFFVDLDLGIRFYQALSKDARFCVEFHDHHFSNGAPDDSEWLPYVAQNGWIAVTHDKKIKRQHRPIIIASKARVLIVIGSRPLSDQAANFCATYGRIERFCRKRSGPYVAKLYYPTAAEQKKLKPKGRIELWDHFIERNGPD